MHPDLTKLISLAGAPLGAPLTRLPEEIIQQYGPLSRELEELCVARNGFFAFESALHVFPVGVTRHGYDLERWNDGDLWRDEYADATAGRLFFAEDVFGEQFCLTDGAIARFHPETGESELIAPSLDGWAGLLLDGYAAETGYPLAHAWQTLHGPLPASQRLLPAIPFVLGGDYTLDNLVARDAVEGMRFRAYLARQLRELPDGAEVEIEFLDHRSV